MSLNWRAETGRWDASIVFAFVVVWNDYVFARVLLNERSVLTMPVGLQDMDESTIVDWGLLMSGAVVVTIPAVRFFVIIQRFLIQGGGGGQRVRVDRGSA